MTTGFDPWDTFNLLAETTGLRLRWTVDDVELDGANAWYFVSGHEIVMDARLNPAELRSVLAHECFHAMSRHAPTGDAGMDAAQELAADTWAAGQLIDGHRARFLFDNGYSLERLAERLGVTEDLVEIRLGLMTA